MAGKRLSQNVAQPPSAVQNSPHGRGRPCYEMGYGIGSKLPFPIRARRAFSLLEVILALGIFMGALAVLGELVRLGSRNAEAARDLTTAQMLCESKLAEISSGLAVPDAVRDQTLATGADGRPEWLASVELAPIDIEGLLAVRVTVTRNLPPEKKPARVSLVRWIPDPGFELPEPPEEASDAAE